MKRIKQTGSDLAFDIVNTFLLILVLIVIIYPLYVVLISSVSSAQAVNAGEVRFRPVDFSWQGYILILQGSDIWIGYRNTILYTFFGTLLNLTVTLLAGYSLSRKDLKGRGIFMAFFVFTMYFSGGLIPTYILVNKIGLYNTPYVLIVIAAMSVYNLIIARTFFQMTIPQELLESAFMDGCGNFKFFIKIVLPLSSALVAVLALYYGQAHWNNFFNALIYLSKRTLYPLQLFLRNILVMNQNINMESGASPEEVEIRLQYAETIKYGLIVLASFPVLVVYPFLQKYFVKGVMIGSIKG
ncbi:MAG: carbohydrate ABC transporter permease [Treponema sp.]|nr:carbohydrate ABC transporter permease [Treponema sp.]